MNLRISSLASLFVMLLASASFSYAQTESVGAQVSSLEAWKKKIATLLVSKRTLPPAAAGHNGTAKVKFVIDRQGRLISRELVESTGSELLDTAALSLIERTEPFPEPPAEVRDDSFAFTVAINFAGSKLLPWAGGQWPAEWVDEQKKIDKRIHGICRGC
jgi:protein TonB